MKVLKTAAIVVGVAAGIAATAVTFGAASAIGAGILGVSWGAIATGAALVSTALTALSPTKPPAGSHCGCPTEYRLAEASP